MQNSETRERTEEEDWRGGRVIRKMLMKSAKRGWGLPERIGEWELVKLFKGYVAYEHLESGLRMVASTIGHDTFAVGFRLPGGEWRNPDPFMGKGTQTFRGKRSTANELKVFLEEHQDGREIIEKITDRREED